MGFTRKANQARSCCLLVGQSRLNVCLCSRFKHLVPLLSDLVDRVIFALTCVLAISPSFGCGLYIGDPAGILNPWFAHLGGP